MAVSNKLAWGRVGTGMDGGREGGELGGDPSPPLLWVFVNDVTGFVTVFDFANCK